MGAGRSISAGAPVPAADGHPGDDTQVRTEPPLRRGGRPPASERAAVYEPVGLFITAKDAKVS